MNESQKVVALKGADQQSLQNARVVSAQGQEIEVLTEEGIQKARVAFSCLVAPAIDDLTLCARDDQGQYYVLAIIDRPGPQDATLAFPAAAAIVAGAGPLTVYSKESVTLAAEQGLNCLSDKAVHKANSATINYESATATGKDLKANFDSVLMVGRMLTTMAAQMIAKAKNYVRQTESHDQIKAGQMSRKADELFTLDSKRSVMVSKKETKIDGERIFMG